MLKCYKCGKVYSFIKIVGNYYYNSILRRDTSFNCLECGVALHIELTTFPSIYWVLVYPFVSGVGVSVSYFFNKSLPIPLFIMFSIIAIVVENKLSLKLLERSFYYNKVVMCLKGFLMPLLIFILISFSTSYLYYKVLLPCYYNLPSCKF